MSAHMPPRQWICTAIQQFHHPEEEKVIRGKIRLFCTLLRAEKIAETTPLERVPRSLCLAARRKKLILFS
jgi:hypothetical protein